MDFVLKALPEDTRLFNAGTPGNSNESEFITMVKLIYLILSNMDLIIFFRLLWTLHSHIFHNDRQETQVNPNRKMKTLLWLKFYNG